MLRITTIIVILLSYLYLNNAQQTLPVDTNSVVICEPPRRCVYVSQCLNGTFNTKGIDVINSKFASDSSNTILYDNQVYPMTVNRTIITRSGEEKPICLYYEQCCGEISITKPIDIGPMPASITTACGFSNPDGIGLKIMNPGKAQFGEYPWMVAVLWKRPDENSPKLAGGGSLINPNVVLTAAHILNDKKSSEFKVRAGEWDTQSEIETLRHQDRNVKKIIIHDHYQELALENEYALLVVDQPFILDPHIQPICLPTPNLYFDYNECYSAGWGKTEFLHPENRQSILKKINLTVVPFQTCQDTLRKTQLGDIFVLHHSFICAGGVAGNDTCTGDGGSPLMCPVYNQPNRYYQAGIVSWGIGCGLDNSPGVYTNVPLARGWIDSKMKELGYDDSSYKLN